MVDLLRPLAPLGGGSAAGLTADTYQQLRRRQTLVDTLAKDATAADGGGGSALGAIGKGVQGLVSGLMRNQNQADIASFAQASPMAAAALQAGQPQPYDFGASPLGRLFGNMGFGGGEPAQPGLLTPDPNNRAGASIGSSSGWNWGAGP